MGKTFLEQLNQERLEAIKRENIRLETIKSGLNNIENQTNMLFDYICAMIKNDLNNNLDRTTSIIDCHFIINRNLIIVGSELPHLTYRVVQIQLNRENIYYDNNNIFHLNQLIRLLASNGITNSVTIADNGNEYKIQIAVILDRKLEKEPKYTRTPNERHYWLC